MRQTKKQFNWFTLVELIVVIVILAILATIAFLSFSSQSWSARDSTRLSDISSIKKSMEMYNVNAWTYPSPDNPYSYTYSWGIIWNQWTIWDSAYKMLQKNLSKKVTDPLKLSEYDYSLASNKREYQVAWNFENPTSLERNYNPFDSSPLSPKLSALWWTGANVYISWNYNWVMLKVFTWSTYYFVPTPTLFWIWTWSTVYDNTFWSGKILLAWINNIAVFNSSKVYVSTSSTWLSTTDVTNLMTTIQAAYLTWNVTTPAVQSVLAVTWSALTDLWVWLVKNSLGGGTSSSPVSNIEFLPVSIWLIWHLDMETLTWWKLKDMSWNWNDWTLNWTSSSGWKVWLSRYFNWSGDYAYIPVNSVLRTTKTAMTWIKSSASSQNWGVISFNDYLNWWEWYIWQAGTSLKLSYINASDAWESIAYTWAISTSWWYNVTMRRTWLHTTEIFLNWNPVATTNNFYQSPTGYWSRPITIWNLYWSSMTTYFKWYVDEILLYDRALTNQEISDYYNATK
ncbi:MAG: hypothetical protein ACD_2C00205G0002 [uncultured bacterium (gcode 4)]|uniref:Uncharacterized protein n=1 Tax=uncultured bacterium (gcode 4) TaxID=1234023 RepID=K2GFX2_9BACT|nr:MAG: hypothetical protein ACD_2C00205G0002 [uncultured bacterium (gcode 4)]